MIDKEKVKELLTYNFFPTGRGVKKEKIEKQIITEEEAEQCYEDSWTHINLQYIEDKLRESLQHLKNKNVTLLYSGGADSTLLALLMQDMNINFKLLNLKFMSYDESKSAKDTADKVLNMMPVETIEVDDYELAHEMPEIMSKMSSPFERGSVLLTHFLLEHSSKTVVAGDTGDYLFMPSFEKEHQAIRLNRIHSPTLTAHEIEKIEYTDNFAYSQRPIKQMLFFDVLHEIPFYYRAKYTMLRKKNQTICLPYQHADLLKYSLRCKTLHKQPNKYYLNELLQQFTDYKFHKQAFKADRTDMQSIIDKYYTTQTLKDFSIPLRIFNERSLKKVKLMSSILKAWRDTNE